MTSAGNDELVNYEFASYCEARRKAGAEAEDKDCSMRDGVSDESKERRKNNNEDTSELREAVAAEQSSSARRPRFAWPIHKQLRHADKNHEWGEWR